MHLEKKIISHDSVKYFADNLYSAIDRGFVLRHQQGVGELFILSAGSMNKNLRNRWLNLRKDFQRKNNYEYCISGNIKRKKRKTKEVQRKVMKTY